MEASELPEANYVPSNENATELTSFLCFWVLQISLPVYNLHNRTVMSSPAEAKCLLSGETLSEYTAVFRLPSLLVDCMTGPRSKR